MPIVVRRRPAAMRRPAAAVHRRPAAAVMRRPAAAVRRAAPEAVLEGIQSDDPPVVVTRIVQPWHCVWLLRVDDTEPSFTHTAVAFDFHGGFWWPHKWQVKFKDTRVA